MIKPTFHSIFLLQEGAYDFFKWPLRWLSNECPSMAVRIMTQPQSVEKILSKKSFFRIYWFWELSSSLEIAKKINTKFPNLEWVLVCNCTSVVLLRAWQQSIPLKAIWHVEDFLYFNFWKYLRSSNTYFIAHSPKIKKLFSYPELQLHTKDNKLLMALQKGETPEQIQESVGFSSSNFYYHLQGLKKQFQLLPETPIITLIKTAEQWGYLEND